MKYYFECYVAYVTYVMLCGVCYVTKEYVMQQLNIFRISIKNVKVCCENQLVNLQLKFFQLAQLLRILSFTKLKGKEINKLFIALFLS